MDLDMRQVQRQGSAWLGMGTGSNGQADSPLEAKQPASQLAGQERNETLLGSWETVII